jgi:hypothetical protein
MLNILLMLSLLATSVIKADKHLVTQGPVYSYYGFAPTVGTTTPAPTTTTLPPPAPYDSYGSPYSSYNPPTSYDNAPTSYDNSGGLYYYYYPTATENNDIEDETTTEPTTTTTTTKAPFVANDLQKLFVVFFLISFAFPSSKSVTVRRKRSNFNEQNCADQYSVKTPFFTCKAWILSIRNWLKNCTISRIKSARHCPKTGSLV